MVTKRSFTECIKTRFYNELLGSVDAFISESNPDDLEFKISLDSIDEVNLEDITVKKDPLEYF